MKPLFDFYDSLAACHDAEDVDKAWQGWAAASGYPRAGTMTIGQRSTGMVMDRIRTNYPAEDVEHYVREGYHRVAPSMNPLRKTARLYGNHIADFSRQVEGKTRKFFDFIDFVHGLEMPAEMTIRFDMSLSDKISLHIWSVETKHLFDLRLREESDRIISAASVTAVRLRLLISQNVQRNRELTPREVDCLLYLARGDRQREIADRFAIDLKTVEMHLRNARDKLSSGTTHQAIATAILSGAIRP